MHQALSDGRERLPRFHETTQTRLARTAGIRNFSEQSKTAQSGTGVCSPAASHPDDHADDH
jgi:hypothetical protein